MKFDKDKARKAFYKKNPQWDELREPFKINSDDIQKIIELWPDTKAAVIAGIIGVDYGRLQVITARMRNSGIILKKNDNTMKKKIDDAIKGLKREG